MSFFKKFKKEAQPSQDVVVDSRFPMSADQVYGHHPDDAITKGSQIFNWAAHYETRDIPSGKRYHRENCEVYSAYKNASRQIAEQKQQDLIQQTGIFVLFFMLLATLVRSFFTGVAKVLNIKKTITAFSISALVVVAASASMYQVSHSMNEKDAYIKQQAYTISQQTEKIKKADADVSVLATGLSELSKQIAQQQQQISSLTEQISQLNDNVVSLEKRVSTSEKKISKMSRQNAKKRTLS